MNRGYCLSSLALCLLLTAGARADSGQAAGEQWISLAKESPEALYVEKCGMCHRDNGMGSFILGRRMAADKIWLEHRDDLQSAFVSNVVRNGFGLMFPMSRGEVSDAQLETIANYLAEGGQ